MASPIKASNSPPARMAVNYRHLTLAGLLALVFVLFFFRLGSYPLFDMDEPRYAEAAREMLQRHDLITPYFNYEVRFDKPVLFYWLIALAYQLFGVSEFAARFFSAVSATAIVGMVYGFGRHWISGRYGLFSAMILASCLLFTAIARMSITDMTLCCFMTGTTLCLFMAAHHNLKWWLAAGFFAGLAMLTKGPVGLVVPGAILVIYTLVTGDFKRWLLNRWMPLAVLIALAIALPWYVLAYRANGPDFLNALFLHNVTRFNDVVSGHKQPIYFYAIVLVAGFMPWTLYLPAAIKRLHRQILENHRAHVQAHNFNYLVPLFAAIWIAFVFIFFTVSHTKLLTYILPLFPALALLTGEAWHLESLESMDTGKKADKWFTVPAWLLVAVGLIGGIVFITHMSKLLPREAAGVVANEYNLVCVVLMIAGCALTAWLLSRKSTALALIAQTATMALLVLVALVGVVPNISRTAQGPMLGYLKQTGRAPLMIYEMQRPSLTFYGRRRVPRFEEADQKAMVAELNKTVRTFVITKNEQLNNFEELLPATMHVDTIEKGPVFSLLSVSNTSPPCDSDWECKP